MAEHQALRIFAWMVPRVNSTALTKCMGYVDDTVVWMEPYWTCYLNETFFNPEFKKGDWKADKTREKLKADEKTVKKFKGLMDKASEWHNLFPQKDFTYQWVKKQLEAPEPGKKFIFIKDLAFVINDHLDCLPENVPTKHMILIRHPREMYTSYKNLSTCGIDPDNPVPWDDCHIDDYFTPVSKFYQIQYKLWKHVKEHLDHDVIIIDSYDLISNPDVVLPKMFEKWGIPFKESYLEWAADPEGVFSSWKGSFEVVAGAAYTTATSRAVHCTKFDPPINPRGVSRPEWRITSELKEFIEGALPFYEEMYANRLC